MPEGGPLCSTGQEGRLHLQLPLLLSAELKPHVAICVRAVPAVTLGIHVQGRSRSGTSTSRVCTVPQGGEGVAEAVTW